MLIGNNYGLRANLVVLVSRLFGYFDRFVQSKLTKCQKESRFFASSQACNMWELWESWFNHCLGSISWNICHCVKFWFAQRNWECFTNISQVCQQFGCLFTLQPQLIIEMNVKKEALLQSVMLISPMLNGTSHLDKIVVVPFTDWFPIKFKRV
jgi:hypothetical protein